MAHARRPGLDTATLAAAVALAAVALASPAQGQSAIALNLGLSTVRYDRFLPSGAAFVSPSVRFELGDAVMGARGTYLVFESGNHSLQGTVAAAALGPRLGRFRLQAAGSAGASSYEEFSRFGHLLGDLRLHYQAGRSGAWLGFGAGRALFGAARSPIRRWTTGAWLRHEMATLALSATVNDVGDTSYTDLEGVARGTLWNLELDGMLGARVWSQGGGRGIYGEGSLALPLREGVALVVSGGRYPTNPTRGSISGRYLTLGVRLVGVTSRRPAARVAVRRALAELGSVSHLPPSSSAGTNATDGAGAGPRLAVGDAVRGTRAIRIQAGAAERVELMGDFTDWRPVALVRVAADAWEIRLPLSPGAHRLNVRVDGGPWVAPLGTREERDEFGSVVGIVVVW